MKTARRPSRSSSPPCASSPARTGSSKAVKEQGGRAALVSKILEAEKRTKDEGYKSRLERFPTPRLLDYYRAAVKRAG